MINEETSKSLSRSYSFDSIRERERTVESSVKRMDEDCYYGFCGSFIDYPDYKERGVTCLPICFNIIITPIYITCIGMACCSFPDSHFLYDSFEDNDMALLRPFFYLGSYPVVKIRRCICFCGGTRGCYDFDIKETGCTEHHLLLFGKLRQAICHCPILCPVTYLIKTISSSNYSLAASKISPNFYRYYGFEILMLCRLFFCCCGRKIKDDSIFHADSQDPDSGNTGIHGAVRADNAFPYQTLRLFGANPDIPDVYGRTPLYHSAKKGNIRFIEKLINDGCDVFHKDEKGVSPFDFFIDKTLIEKYKTHKQFSIYHACQHGYADILQSILNNEKKTEKNEINLNIKRPFDNNNPLELACFHRNQSCVDILIAYDHQIDPGCSLHFACEAKDTIMISSLLTLNNIDIAKKNEKGLVAFSLFDETDLLLEYLADQEFTIKSLETNEYSLWFYLIQQNNPRICNCIQKYVKKYPELIYCKDADHRLALDVATEKNKNAIKSVTLWFGRYRLIERRAEHVSKTCMIFRVVDETQEDGSGNYKRAAIKIMKIKSQFLKEVNIRNNNNFEHHYILNIFASYPELCDNNNNDKDIDNFHLLESGNTTIPREVVDKMYCIVMPLGDRNLYSCLKSERWAGPEYTAKVRSTFLKIVDCVQTLNIVRLEAEFVLIDLDAACLIDQEFVGEKSSSAYSPPEAIYVNKENNIAFVKSSTAYQIYAPDVTPDLLLAHPSFDIWSLGCILYQMCTDDVRQLFQAGQDDNLSSNIDDVEDSLFTLAEWSENIKTKKLNKISNTNSRNLVSMMLSKDPMKRPTLTMIKEHPFLSLHRAEKTMKGRGQLLSHWQVFLSYRVNSDTCNAREIYDRLTAKGISVWWDKVSLLPGKNWKEGFCEGLISCPTFVCVISRNAINNNSNPRNNYSKLNELSPCDNVLLEHRLALEMMNMGHIQQIFPIMVGDESFISSRNSLSQTKAINNITHDHFFEKGCLPNAPNICIPSIEKELREIMEVMGLGTPLEENKSVSSILSDILQYQGAKIEGDRNTALDDAVDQITKMIL